MNDTSKLVLWISFTADLVKVPNKYEKLSEKRTGFSLYLHSSLHVCTFDRLRIVKKRIHLVHVTKKLTSQNNPHSYPQLFFSKRETELILIFTAIVRSLVRCLLHRVYGGCKLQVAGCRCRLQVAGCRLQVAGAGCRLQVQVAGCRLQVQVAGCRVQVAGAGCRLQVAGCRCRLQVAGCRLQVAGCGLRVAGCG